MPSTKIKTMKKVMATVAAFLLVGSLSMNAQQQEPAKKEGEKKEHHNTGEHKGENKEHHNNGEHKGEHKGENKDAQKSEHKSEKAPK